MRLCLCFYIKSGYVELVGYTRMSLWKTNVNLASCSSVFLPFGNFSISYELFRSISSNKCFIWCFQSTNSTIVYHTAVFSTVEMVIFSLWLPLVCFQWWTLSCCTYNFPFIHLHSKITHLLNTFTHNHITAHIPKNQSNSLSNGKWCCSLSRSTVNADVDPATITFSTTTNPFSIFPAKATTTSSSSYLSHEDSTSTRATDFFIKSTSSISKSTSVVPILASGVFESTSDVPKLASDVS